MPRPFNGNRQIQQNEGTLVALQCGTEMPTLPSHRYVGEPTNSLKFKGLQQLWESPQRGLHSTLVEYATK